MMNIEEAVSSNLSIAGTIRSLGRAIVGSNYRWVKSEVNRLNLDTSHWKGQSHGTTPQKRLSFDVIFCENSMVPKVTLKKRIHKDKLIPYVCAECNSGPTWREKPMTLRLDHVNGNNNDNRLTNLRFMCPNCDSQSKTFCGRNKSKHNMNTNT